jgi:hypothetical protein
MLIFYNLIPIISSILSSVNGVYLIALFMQYMAALYIFNFLAYYAHINHDSTLDFYILAYVIRKNKLLSNAYNSS